MALPAKVEICECWARDGIQGEELFIPTDIKIQMIEQMANLGFRRLEATSFSHPKLVKQFADSLEVLKGIPRRDDLTYIAIIPNQKALERLLDCCQAGYGVQEITAIISASEDHLLANLERTMAEAKPPLAQIVRQARAEGLKVIGCIGTAFGCPLSGEVPLPQVKELTDWYLEQGADYIMLGDTTGEANPLQVRRVYQEMLDQFPGVKFIGHFHDTRGMGLANTLAALEQGVVYHDGSLGGIGGQPSTKRPKYHSGLSGNTCTEDMLVMLDELGVATGVDTMGTIELSRRVEQVCGRELLGHTTRSGPVRHRSRQVLDTQALQPGREVSPALYLWQPEAAGSGLTAAQKAEQVIRQALGNNWPLPSGLKLGLGELEIKTWPQQRAVLLTRFKVLAAGDRARLEALCQKSDGEVVFQGPVTVSIAA
ncbi:MAG: hydroxymethylglutaryl-CoA lyase [Thermodesulfobacteriota bacterium]